MKIGQFIKLHYDDIRLALDFDNVARKRLMAEAEDALGHFDTWQSLYAHIEREWLALGEELDPLDAVRNALLPIAEARGRQAAVALDQAVGYYIYKAQKEGEAVNGWNKRQDIDHLAQAGAYIAAAIQKLQQSL